LVPKNSRGATERIVNVSNGIVLKYSFSNSTRKFNVDSITSSYNKDLKNGWGGVEAVSMSNF
jgi:hypothetical protein